MTAIFRRATLLCALVVLTSCSTDALLDPSDRPNTPAADAFNADFSFFADNEPAAGGTTENWDRALARIAAADAAMSPTLEVPRAALTAVSGTAGTREGNSWHFPFSFEIDGAPFDGVLRSSIVGGQYSWDLFIDAPEHDPPLSDYLWATGVAGATVRNGQWQIADADNGTSELEAVLVWVVNQTGDVEFAFSNDQSVGWSYLRSDETTVLTRGVNGAPEWRVTWHADTGTGSTWTADTNITQCWNAQLHDVVCP